MKRVLFYVAAISIAIFSSCNNKDDNEASKKSPVVKTSDVSVMVNSETKITFNFTAEAGFKAAAVVASKGTATIDTKPSAGATSGKIVVSYKATDASVKAAIVTLTITDNDAKLGNAASAVTITEKPVEETTIEVSSNITKNTTWEKGKIYILKSRISVVSGITLTIEPGVIVKGDAGSGANATALIIARGAKIMAEGTETSPIIFTSVADKIKAGEIASPNLSTDLDGLWGGVIVLGKAKISVDGNTQEAAIEGIPADDENGKYGGNNNADNSGVIKYVSIRHGGSNIGEGNEINGLTLGGVGSGTTIENVEIIANQDDGVEWFGGTVNVKNLIAWNVGDDAVDTDQGWSGTLDNFIVINPGDKCFELDGPEGSINKGSHTIKNGNVKVGKSKGLLDLDEGKGDKNTLVSLSNIYWYGVSTKGDPAKAEYVDTKDVTYTKPFYFSATEGDSRTKADFFDATLVDMVTVISADDNSKGANLTPFKASWSWAIAAKAN